ncbi:MAG: sugar phosphate nucleotidyltransferase [Candidatus Neomarinimicrobiota bacterium]|nr:sugar phosphate nucleotidyltransferase [Candidatus Neomarinimicrobiota bacterium]
MKVIIPAAGHGTRLRPHTDRRQKCLLPVAGKPVIDHILEPLIDQGFDEIVLVTGYLEEQLREYVSKFEADFSFAPQSDPLGLGHAVFQGLEDSDDPALIQLGDVIYDVDLCQFCKEGYHRIAVNEVPDPQRFGIVKLDGDRIVKVIEKPENPPSNLAIIGLYFLSSQRPLWEAIKYLMDKEIITGGEIQLADALDLMVKNGEIITAERCEKWYDCGVPESFLETNRALLKPSNQSVEGSTIIEPVHIGSDCRITTSTIGPNVTVMDGATISNCEVSDSIILWNAHLEGRSISKAIVEEG